MRSPKFVLTFLCLFLSFSEEAGDDDFICQLTLKDSSVRQPYSGVRCVESSHYETLIQIAFVSDDQYFCPAGETCQCGSINKTTIPKSRDDQKIVCPTLSKANVYVKCKCCDGFEQNMFNSCIPITTASLPTTTPHHPTAVSLNPKSSPYYPTVPTTVPPVVPPRIPLREPPRVPPTMPPWMKRTISPWMLPNPWEPRRFSKSVPPTLPPWMFQTMPPNIGGIFSIKDSDARSTTTIYSDHQSTFPSYYIVIIVVVVGILLIGICTACWLLYGRKIEKERKEQRDKIFSIIQVGSSSLGGAKMEFLEISTHDEPANSSNIDNEINSRIVKRDKLAHENIYTEEPGGRADEESCYEGNANQGYQSDDTDHQSPEEVENHYQEVNIDEDEENIYSEIK